MISQSQSYKDAKRDLRREGNREQRSLERALYGGNVRTASKRRKRGTKASPAGLQENGLGGGNLGEGTRPADQP